MTNHRILSAALISLGLGLPVPALAQVYGHDRHETAVSIQANASVLSALARMHVESARQRGSSDAQTQLCLSKAAHLQYYAGNPAQARRLLIEAAEVALERGDVEFAAHSLLSAAVVAQEIRDPGVVRDLVRRAELLALAPMLTDEQRARIESRISRGSSVVAVKN
jgi:hypothetical protein